MPDKCPLCSSNSFYLEYEENDNDRYFIGWKCSECGCVWVNKFAYASTEVFTKKEWES